ncbi:hypothetical protein DRO91_02390 [Candidatus Heimdallarchaeota archaeon]|nr:MAG: hypothetical protein DRP02_07835 [Candidatus Gerdarchaeota archaeon]RLI73686.1 MAG: hypothetical protein DRO91_02390 [Candidatus Heimdallarchaeota archaeon]
MAKIFITGATGQVGRQLVNYLLKEKKLGVESPLDIACLIRNPGKAQELIDLGIDVVEGDLLASDTISEAMNNGIQFVFHIAADINVNHSYEEMYPTNVLGTRIILDAFVNSKAQCFIYTSSIAVYDTESKKEKELQIDEDFPIGPTEGLAYAVTKRLAEAMVKSYQKDYPEKRFIITRLGPILGPGDRQFLPTIIQLLSYRFIPKLINRGKYIMSLTSPIDIARAQVFLAEQSGMLQESIFNIAQGFITFREILETVSEYYHRRPPKFSITFWFFKILRPFIVLLHKIFPRINLLKVALSPTTSHYIGRSFYFNSERLLQLGFKFSVHPKEAILTGLEYLDPQKTLLKPSWFYKQQE